MALPALSLSRSPSSSVSSSPVDRCPRSTSTFRRFGSSFAYKPAAGICSASQAIELLPSLCPEIVVRDAQLEDCWEVTDTHCSSFFPDYKFPLDLVLRIDRYIALLSGFSVPPGCMRTCLVAVNSNSVNNSFSIERGDPRDARAGFQKYNLNRGSIAGILTIDTVADYLPRRGPLKQRRYCLYSKCRGAKGGTSERDC